MADTKAYDLSRLVDRARDIEHELEDMMVSKVGDEVDKRVAGAVAKALIAAEELVIAMHDIIGDPDAYVPIGRMHARPR